MSNLKVGMRVVAVTDYPENSNKRINIGDFGTIIDIVGDYVNVKFDNQYNIETFYSWRVEPVTEEPKQMFNIKTDPWFIRVNSKQEFEVIQGWLEENYGEKLRANYGTYMEWLTNTQDSGYMNSKLIVMHGRGHPSGTTPRKEIKLTFKTTTDSVEYPVVKSKEQIKIEELQATIDKACKEIKELRELGENK